MRAFLFFKAEERRDRETQRKVLCVSLLLLFSALKKISLQKKS